MENTEFNQCVFLNRTYFLLGTLGDLRQQPTHRACQPAARAMI